jgi:hypothetical protein
MPAGQQKTNDKEESIIAEHNSTCEFRHSPLRLTIPNLVLLDCSGRISESTPGASPRCRRKNVFNSCFVRVVSTATSETPWPVGA